MYCPFLHFDRTCQYFFYTSDFFNADYFSASNVNFNSVWHSHFFTMFSWLMDLLFRLFLLSLSLSLCSHFCFLRLLRMLNFYRFFSSSWDKLSWEVNFHLSLWDTIFFFLSINIIFLIFSLSWKTQCLPKTDNCPSLCLTRIPYSWIISWFAEFISQFPASCRFSI